METDPRVLNEVLFLHHALEQTQAQVLKLAQIVEGLTEVVRRQAADIQSLQIANES